MTSLAAMQPERVLVAHEARSVDFAENKGGGYTCSFI
jgi:hypothetical protein